MDGLEGMGCRGGGGLLVSKPNDHARWDLILILIIYERQEINIYGGAGIPFSLVLCLKNLPLSISMDDRLTGNPRIATRLRQHLPFPVFFACRDLS